MITIVIPSGYLTLPWKPWPIEIDGLPIKNGDFPWKTVSHNHGPFIDGLPIKNGDFPWLC